MKEDQKRIQDGNTFREFTEDGRRIYHKSMGNAMSKPAKAVYYAVTLWGNRIINKLPSRHIRRWFYQMLGAKFGKNCFPCRRVEILLPKGLELGDGAVVAAGAVVTKDVEPWTVVGGIPAKEIRKRKAEAAYKNGSVPFLH